MGKLIRLVGYDLSRLEHWFIRNLLTREYTHYLSDGTRTTSFSEDDTVQIGSLQLPGGAFIPPLLPPGYYDFKAGEAWTKYVYEAPATSSFPRRFEAREAYENVAFHITGGGGVDQITTRSGNDSVRGGGSADVIRTGAGDDTVFGGSGNDSIDAASGDNVVYGGVGDDTLDAGLGRSTIFGDAGNDVITVDGARSLAHGGAGNDVLKTTGVAARLFGGEGNDFLYGGSFAGSLSGGVGNDVLFGGAGDSLFGDAGNDAFNFFPGQQIFIDGGTGSDRVENILAGFYSLNLTSPGTFELLTSEPPFPAVQAATEFKNIEILRVVGLPTVSGSADFEIVTKGDAGKAGRQAVAGTDASDFVIGGRGGDHLFGGRGHDTFSGSGGADTTMGGSGNDTFRFAYSTGKKTTDGSDVVSGDAGFDVFSLSIDRSTSVDVLVGGVKVNTIAWGTSFASFTLAADAELRFQDQATIVSLSGIERVQWTFV